MVHRAGNAKVVDLRLFEVLDFLSLPRIFNSLFQAPG